MAAAAAANAMRGAHHRRARSEVAFRLPDDLDLASAGGDADASAAFDEIGSEDDLFSTFMDIEKISSGPAADRDRDRDAETSSPPRPKHRYSSSVDGSGLFSAAASAARKDAAAAQALADVLEAKKAMSPEQLAELAAIDPKRAKRCRHPRSLSLTHSLLRPSLLLGCLCVLRRCRLLTLLSSW
jgi:hypothetical protein